MYVTLRFDKKKGKRVYLNNALTQDLTSKLNAFFESEVEGPRIKVGKRQTVETLMDEEALLLAEFLRDEKKTWISRVPCKLVVQKQL